MLRSFGSSHDEDDDPPSDLQCHLHHHHRYVQPRPTAQPAVQMRQLLISCAELISQSNFSAASRLVSILFANSSPYGDSTERLVHQFARALTARLSRFTTPSSLGPVPNPAAEPDLGTGALQSCYLSLNQVTPFIRFSHLTANQAILEAIEGQRAVHIVDFDIIHGVQWPPLMQAIAERVNSPFYPPPMLRITGAGPEPDVLSRTGDRLTKFAQSLGLKFQFHPLHLHGDDPAQASLFLSSSLSIFPDETLAVNCVSFLHRLLNDDVRGLRAFLRSVRELSPRVVTVAEREASHNHPVFMQRFVEAVDHYAAVFESLEATLPPNSRERLAVEQVWFGREIMDIVAAEGGGRRERHQRFEAWEVALRSEGFTNVPLSPFALSQAKLLLRLHYPSEGYQLQTMNNSVFLGWQNRKLFSVSSWH